MTEEGKSRRKALNDRLKARRRAKEAEVERRGAGERERCDQDAELTRLEELEVEVCVYSTTTLVRQAAGALLLHHISSSYKLFDASMWYSMCPSCRQMRGREENQNNILPSPC